MNTGKPTSFISPFLFLIKEGAEGNEAFEGFAIDLLKAISEYLEFKVSCEAMAA